MSKNIHRKKVVDYIKDTMEPVHYDVLRSKFCGSKCSEESTKALHDVLVAEVKAGRILHYEDHFFAPKLAFCLRDSIYESNEDSDDSVISISSCESVAAKSSKKEKSKMKNSKNLEGGNPQKAKPKSKKKT